MYPIREVTTRRLLVVAADNLLCTFICPEPYYDFHSTPRQRSYPRISHHGPGKIGETAGCSRGQADRFVFNQNEIAPTLRNCGAII